MEVYLISAMEVYQSLSSALSGAVSSFSKFISPEVWYSNNFQTIRLKMTKIDIALL